MAEQSGVQSVERAFDLIELMCKNGEMSVTALSAGTGLHKTTVCRLLGTLTMLGYVRQSSRTGHYGLTLKFLKISSGLLGSYDFSMSRMLEKALNAVFRPKLRARKGSDGK